MIPTTVKRIELETTRTAYSDGVGFLDGRKNHIAVAKQQPSSSVMPMQMHAIALDCGLMENGWCGEFGQTAEEFEHENEDEKEMCGRR